MRIPALAFLLLLILPGCSTRREMIPPPLEDPGSDKIVIYQLMTRLFGNTVSTNKPFGTLEENGVGKFNDITPRALAGIRELGVTHVWYTGVLEHPTLTDYSALGIPSDDPDVVKGRAGSPYTIKDYYDVDPDLAVRFDERMKEFEALVERTHSAGMKVIIDFVPNHVARRYASDAKPEGVADLGEADDPSQPFRADNNFYYLPGQSFQPPAEPYRRPRSVFPNMDGRFEEKPAKATGDDKFTANPPADSWYESVKLNYGVDYQQGSKTHFDSIPDTWTKMKDILLFWAKKGVDGFRCDMAEKVPVEFWNWAIPQVKALNPEIIFIAEIYIPSMYRDYIDRGRFDFLYDKVQLYDTLKLLLNGRVNAREIGSLYNTQDGLHERLVHFMENHDEQRIASSQFAKDPRRGLPAMLVSATIDSGPVLIYFGQEVGEPGDRAEGFGENDGRTTMFDYWGVPEHQKWMNGGAFDGALLSENQRTLRQAYKRMLNIVHQEEAIRSGEFIQLEAVNPTTGRPNERIVVFGRLAGSEALIIIAGFNPREESIAIKLGTDSGGDLVGGYDREDIEIVDLLGDSTQVIFDDKAEFLMKLPPYGTSILKPVRKTDNPMP